MDQQTRQILENSVASFARPDSARTRIRRSSPPGFSRQTWSELAAQGWLAVLAPESAGGLNLGVSEASIIARRLGYALFTEPYASVAVFALSCASSFAAMPLISSLLPNLTAGKTITSIAWQGSQGRIEIDATPGRLTEQHGNSLLSGNYGFVPAPSADNFIVLAAGTAGLELIWVDRAQQGLEIESHLLADGTEGGTLHFRDSLIKQGQHLAGGDNARAAMNLALDRALLAGSAELVGNMERCLEMTLSYLRERKQFGRAIGSFQALKHRAVDLWIQKELAGVAVGRAAIKADDPGLGWRERAALASGAKMRASQAALKMATEAIQLHGAIGYTDDFDLGLYLKRALVLSAQFGNAAAHRSRYSLMSSAP